MNEIVALFLHVISGKCDLKDVLIFPVVYFMSAFSFIV